LKKTNAYIPEIKLLNYFKQMADGLSEVHDTHNWIHRDIKPANIFLTQDNVVKIGDFGAMTDDAENPTMGPGTFLYCAPERFFGEFSKSSDIWSLGLVLYELCSLKDIKSVKKDASEEKFELFPDKIYSEKLTSLIKSMLFQDPSKRPVIAAVKGISNLSFIQCRKTWTNVIGNGERNQRQKVGRLSRSTCES
jgi:serine/threonine protein kinase